MGLCIDACLSCCWKLLLLCVGYFVSVNRADYHGNVWRWSDFRFTFVQVKKAKSSMQGFFFHFSRRWFTHLVTHRKINIQTLSGETVRMCRLAWSFAARICDKYINHINWYKLFSMSLHLHSFFLAQSAKALARLRKCAASSDHSLLVYVTFFMNWA